MKGCSAGGNLLAKMLPTFEKCLFKILGIREESLVRLLKQRIVKTDYVL